METEDKKHHCYLIISPDPSEELELNISGTAYAKTDSSDAKLGGLVSIGSKKLHFVKFGDETGTEERVKGYRTHNPSCKLIHASIAIQGLMCLTVWWRTILLKDETGVGNNLGKHLEKTYLKGLEGPYGRAEWHASYSTDLKKLCKDLDGETNPKDPWLASEFENMAAIDEVFRDYFKT